MTEKYSMESSHGVVEIWPSATPEELAPLTLNPGIGVFSGFRSLLTSIESLQNLASQEESQVSVAVWEGSIVGFAVRRPPEEGDRWSMMDPPILHEVFSEVARGWRSQGLAKPLLRLVSTGPENDGRILYIVGYSWHWDLDETKKTTQEYRDTIIHLLTPLGFKQYPTNEPNIGLRPENLFMARLGPAIDKPLKKKFTNVLFGIFDD